MGVVENIDFDLFPRQGGMLGKDVEVCFKYNTDRVTYGKVIRDDSEKPYLTIIQLNNGRVVLATECQYKPVLGKDMN